MSALGDLIALLGLVTTLAVIGYEYRRTADIATPLHLVWGFFGYFFLLSYLHIRVVGESAYLHPFSMPEATATTALVHVFGATVMVTVGYYLRLPTRLGQLTVRQLPEPRINPRVGRHLGLVAYVFGLFAAAIFILKNGGMDRLLDARNIFVFRTANNSLRYWIGLQVGLFSGLALYVSGSRFTDSHRLPYLLCVFTGGLFFLMHTRVRALFCVLLLALYAWYAHEAVTLRRLFGIATLALVAFVYFRPMEMLLQGKPPSQAGEYLRYYLFAEPGGAFLYTDYLQGYMALVAGVPDRVPLQWGRTFIALPWIPFEPFVQMRAVASDPMELTELAVYGYDRPGTATIATGFGILFVNFGVSGLLLGAMALGIIFRWAYVVWQQARDSVILGAMYFIMIYYFYRMLSKSFLMYNLLIVLVWLRLLWEVADYLPVGAGGPGSRMREVVEPPVRQIWTQSKVRAYGAWIRSHVWAQSTVRAYIGRIRSGWSESSIKHIITQS